jgi:two-component system, OmpR family, response regulator
MENQPQKRILLAEDDINLGSLLRDYLQMKKFEVDWAKDGQVAMKFFEKNHYDICVFDIMMPIMDGFTLAREIRIHDSEIPILFLTAKSMKDDVLEGFSLGADDYITKPFNMEELIYRIEAVLRRMRGGYESKEGVVNIGKYQFDPQKQILLYEGESTKLTSRETDLLKLLSNNVNRILERNYALKSIWTDDNYFNSRSMDVYITKLRKYLKNDPSVQIINVHGKGFKLLTG